MNPLKVLYLTPPDAHARALAAQTFVSEEILALRDAGVVPYVVSDAIAGNTIIDGVQITGMPPIGPSNLLRAARLAARRLPLLRRIAGAAEHTREVAHALRIEAAAAAVVEREDIDVIHSHFGWPAGFGGSIAAAATGRPLVASLRGTDVLLRPDLGYGLRLDPGYDAAFRHLLDAANRIVVATRFMRTQVLSLGGRNEVVQILEKGVDGRRFQIPEDRNRSKALLGLHGAVILAVAALKRRKRLDLVIDAMAGLPDATLVICGVGEERDALARRAAACGVGARVQFAGEVSRAAIAHYFAAADLFVHTAEVEAAGNVILEAMASGCAVVVTNSGGPAEYVEDGLTGYVVPVGDGEMLAARMRDLLHDAPLRARFGRASRRRVEQRHEYARMVDGLRTIYEQLAALSPAARARHRPHQRPADGRHRADADLAPDTRQAPGSQPAR